MRDLFEPKSKPRAFVDIELRERTFLWFSRRVWLHGVEKPRASFEVGQPATVSTVTPEDLQRAAAYVLYCLENEKKRGQDQHTSGRLRQNTALLGDYPPKKLGPSR